MKLLVTSDRNLIRADAQSRRFLSLSIQAPIVESDYQRPDVNISFVLDRSGSMGGEKIRLAKKAIEQGLERLKATDYFSLIAYDNRVELLQATTPATSQAKRYALDMLNQVYPRGSTNLSDGWLHGCQQIAKQLNANILGRCFLLTDGLANQGIVDTPELVQHASELRKRSISTSTFGIGEDFHEGLLGQMADAGGGSFTFIEHPRQIPTLINQELGETLEVVARDVQIVLKTPKGVAVDVVGPYPVEARHGTYHISLPDLISDQDLTFPVRLSFPTGIINEQVAVDISIQDRDGVFHSLTSQVEFTYAEHKSNDKQDRNEEVDILVAQHYAAQAKEEASQLNRDGHFEKAEYILRRVAKKIRWYANGRPELLLLIQELEQTARRYRVPLDSLSLKLDYFSSSSVARGRLLDGRKKRSRRSRS